MTKTDMKKNEPMAILPTTTTLYCMTCNQELEPRRLCRCSQHEKMKTITEKRIREIIREEIAKIPPTFIPYPQPYQIQPNYQQGYWCPFCQRYNCGQTHVTCKNNNPYDRL